MRTDLTSFKKTQLCLPGLLFFRLHSETGLMNAAVKTLSNECLVPKREELEREEKSHFSLTYLDGWPAISLQI